MRQIQASEAKTKFLQLLDDVERGDTLIITRHGKPIARLSPEVERRQEEIREAMDAIRKLRPRFGQMSVKEIISARDEGRKR
jgi:prevent-host-death family protein